MLIEMIGIAECGDVYHSIFLLIAYGDINCNSMSQHADDHDSQARSCSARHCLPVLRSHRLALSSKAALRHEPLLPCPMVAQYGPFTGRIRHLRFGRTLYNGQISVLVGGAMKLANVVRRCFPRSPIPETGGVVIGGWGGKRTVYCGNDHVVAIGGERSGKTVGLVIPTLMHYRGSIVVHDVGGELYDLTAKYRRAMGQVVIRFAPGDGFPRDGFKLEDLQNGETPVTLYLTTETTEICAAKHKETLATILRASLSTANHRHKMLLLLDDYARLAGGVPALSDDIAFMADHGIQSFITVQNVDQLKGMETIFANSPICIFFPPNDMDTAQYLSDLLGTVNTGRGIHKPLMGPAELLHMPRHVRRRRPGVGWFTGTNSFINCFTLRAGQAPLLGALVPYYLEVGHKLSPR